MSPRLQTLLLTCALALPAPSLRAAEEAAEAMRAARSFLSSLDRAVQAHRDAPPGDGIEFAAGRWWLARSRVPRLETFEGQVVRTRSKLLAGLFTGNSSWRPAYEALVATVEELRDLAVPDPAGPSEAPRRQALARLRVLSLRLEAEAREVRSAGLEAGARYRGELPWCTGVVESWLHYQFGDGAGPGARFLAAHGTAPHRRARLDEVSQDFLFEWATLLSTDAGPPPPDQARRDALARALRALARVELDEAASPADSLQEAFLAELYRRVATVQRLLESLGEGAPTVTRSGEAPAAVELAPRLGVFGLWGS